MSTTLPSPRSSGEIERGDVAEVVAFGNALTELFNALGISQNAYAVRVHRDKSVVSRYLRGKKVASPDFVDGLIREVERHRHTPLKPEVRVRLDQLRLAAIKATDPAAYELESLRAEMQRSQREVGRLVRQQEALHGLLERREAEIRAVQCELAQVQQDWRDEVVLRVQREDDPVDSVRDRTSLTDEVAQLRADLQEATELRAHAERRCEDLEQRVREMEEELAAREGDMPGALPLAAFQERLVVLWEAGKSQEAGRELSEAAQGRSVAELTELVTWLDERGDSVRRNRLAEEVVHTRTVDVVAAFGSQLMRIKTRPRDTRERRGTPSALWCAIDGACAAMAPQDLVTLHRIWSPLAKARRPAVQSPVLGNLLNGLRSADVTAEVLDQLGPDDESVVQAVHRMRVTPRFEGMLIALVPRLIARGHVEMAHECCRRLARHSREHREGWRHLSLCGAFALAEMDSSQVRDFVATCEQLSTEELAWIFLGLFVPDGATPREAREARRFFQLCLAHLRTRRTLAEVATALQTTTFAMLKDDAPVRLRKALLAYQP
ncbi:hypothetical protein [Streptomyces sp. WG-D5]